MTGNLFAFFDFRTYLEDELAKAKSKPRKVSTT